MAEVRSESDCEMDEKFTETSCAKMDPESNVDQNDMDNEENYYKKPMLMTSTAEGCINFTLLAANGSQLRNLLSSNELKHTLYYTNLCLIILSLVLQVSVGITIILKKTTSEKSLAKRFHQFYLIFVFIITFINVLIFVFTTIKK